MVTVARLLIMQNSSLFDLWAQEVVVWFCSSCREDVSGILITALF